MIDAVDITDILGFVPEEKVVVMNRCPKLALSLTSGSVPRRQYRTLDLE